MTIYHVRARLKEDTASRLLERINDGSIRAQRPDGPELVASLERAVVANDGSVEWSEMCFCHEPLYHERKTVLDDHFIDITTAPVAGHLRPLGRPFLQYLEEVAG